MRRSHLPLSLVSLFLLAACGGGTPTAPPPPAQALCPPGGALSLAVGEQIIVQHRSTYCFNFASSGSVTEYLLGVQSVGEGGVAIRNITVSGQLVTTAAQQAAPARAAPSIQARTGGLSPISPALQANPGFQLLQNHRTAHRARLSRMMEPVLEAGTRQALLSRAQGTPAAPPGIVTGNEEIGDRLDFRVRKGNSRDCEAPASATVTAELRVKNDKSMWFVDVGNPAGGFSDEELQEMADLFDDFIYSTETASFGVPNDKDGNGLIGIVVTKQINMDNGDGPAVIGFVNPCDLFTRGEENVHTSNEGEFFYAVAPDPEGMLGQVMVADGLFDFLPVVITHEFAHIIQFSHRFGQTGEFMATFMAEGQATLAEEIVGHAILANGIGQNLSVDVAFDLDKTQSYPWYWNPWIDLIYYFGWPGGEVEEFTPRVAGAPEECTWTDEGEDDPCGSRPLWYGVTWSFLRWAADQFGDDFGGEPLLHQAIISNNVAGFDNLRDVLGPFGTLEDLLAQWAAAFYMDDRPGQSDPRHVVSSWNYFSVNSRFKTQAWLEPARKSYGTFSEDVRVRDPSIAYFLIGGSTAPQFSLKVEGAGGGTLGSDIQVWLVRTK